MKRTAIFCVAGAALALLPATAGAATVEVVNGTFRYSAAAGEVSQVTVTRHASGFEVVSDGVLTAAAGCTAAEGRALCPLAPNGLKAQVLLGDGHDWVRTVVDAGVTQGFDIAGGAGDDQLQGAGGDDILDGGSGKDYLLAHGGSDLVLPGSDAVKDTVQGGDGIDTVSYAGHPLGVAVTLDGLPNDGVDGEDALFGDFEHATGGDGDDVLSAVAAGSELRGGGGDDVLDGGDGEDSLYGGDGHDTARGGAARDFVRGEAGDDHLLGGAGLDNVWGDAGGDLIEGGADADTLHGDAGDDTMLGGDGNDYVSAGGGVNVLDGGAGADDLIAWGGPTDTVTYADRTAPVTVTVSDSTGLLPPDDDGEAGEGDNVVGAERVIGGSAADVLVGGAGPSELLGGAGDDRLAGGDGADRLDGGLGLDAFNGGNGDDVVAARDRITEHVACGAGTDTVTADPREDAGRDCETISRGGK